MKHLKKASKTPTPPFVQRDDWPDKNSHLFIRPPVKSPGNCIYKKWRNEGADDKGKVGL